MVSNTDDRDKLDVTTSGAAPHADVSKFLIDEPDANPPPSANTRVGAGALASDKAVAAAQARSASAEKMPAPTSSDDMPLTPKPAPLSVAQGGTAVEGSTLSAEQLEVLTTDIVAAIKTVYDPEIPTDVYELGLIYKIDITNDRDVNIDMTLTAPGCPVAGEMPVWVENAVASVAGVGDVFVQLTFDPPWDQAMMSDEARLALNMF